MTHADIIFIGAMILLGIIAAFTSKEGDKK